MKLAKGIPSNDIHSLHVLLNRAADALEAWHAEADGSDKDQDKLIDELRQAAKMLTHLDLCSGIGGFTVASSAAGFQTIGFSEIEPYCCKILSQDWPHIKNYGDLRHADFSLLRGNVTVLSAGVPCQPASFAGKRRGSKDDRWLWPAVFDVVGSVQPTWCIFENPSGILSLDEFEGILLRLGSLGYAIRLFRVPANAVGAKHLRYRVFIVAHAEHNGCPCAQDSGSVGSRSSSDACWARAEQSSGPDCGTDGNEVVAHAEPERCNGRSNRWATADRSGASVESAGSSENAKTLANADGTGLEKHQPREPGQCQTSVRSRGFNGTQGQSESGFRREFDGFSDWPHPLISGRVENRAARLKALGNAVVPAQVYPFFAAIKETEYSFDYSLA